LRRTKRQPSRSRRSSSTWCPTIVTAAPPLGFSPITLHITDEVARSPSRLTWGLLTMW